MSAVSTEVMIRLLWSESEIESESMGTGFDFYGIMRDLYSG